MVQKRNLQNLAADLAEAGEYLRMAHASLSQENLIPTSGTVSSLANISQSLSIIDSIAKEVNDAIPFAPTIAPLRHPKA